MSTSIVLDLSPPKGGYHRVNEDFQIKIKLS
jgi:hypothetical protein